MQYLKKTCLSCNRTPPPRRHGLGTGKGWLRRRRNSFYSYLPEPNAWLYLAGIFNNTEIMLDKEIARKSADWRKKKRMEKGYWFKSDLFRIQKGEDLETNPGCFGKELGNWLCKKFKDIGYDVEDLIAEDWGWCVMCSRDKYLLWIGCGAEISDDFLENYDPESPPDGRAVVWHVFPAIEVPFFYIKSWIGKMAGRLDTKGPMIKLNEELKDILEAEPRIDLCERP